MQKNNLRRVNRKSIYRILDVNLNRCREGLRVIEDISRLYYNREKIYQKIRGIRHRLDRIFHKMYPRLLVARQVQRDPGRKLKEKKRKFHRASKLSIILSPATAPELICTKPPL